MAPSVVHDLRPELHLAHVFSLGAKASLRYTSAVTESKADQAPNTR